MKSNVWSASGYWSKFCDGGGDGGLGVDDDDDDEKDDDFDDYDYDNYDYNERSHVYDYNEYTRTTATMTIPTTIRTATEATTPMAKLMTRIMMYWFVCFSFVPSRPSFLVGVVAHVLV